MKGLALELVGEIMKLTVLAAIAIAGILVVLIWKRNLSSKVTYLRFIVQALSVVVIFYLFTYPIWLLLIFGIIVLMTIVFGRVFCGWLCPFGFYMDLVTLIRKVTRVRYRSLPDKLNSALHKSRYIILLVFLVLPFVLSNIGPERFSMAWFFAGPFKPMKVLLEPLIPPVVPWAGLFVVNDINFSYPYVQEIVEYVGADYGTLLAYVFVGLTLAGTFIYRRFWCRFCPTGSSLGIVNRLKGFKWAPVLYLDKNEEKCTKCGICKRVCPVQVTEVYEQKGGKIMTSMCMLCLRCVEMCPYEDCLKVKLGGKTVFKSRNWLEPAEVK
jgi:ferredoxin-type protein NapH